MRVADTSALYALMVPEDAHHRRALEDFADDEPILVPSEIWSETLALYQFRKDPSVSRKAAQAFRRLPHLDVQPTPDATWDDIQGLAERIYHETPKLSYPDAVVVAWARARRLHVLAYDDALLRAVST